MPNTLKTSAIDLCNIFVTKAMQQTAQRESLFWWKDDAMMALKAIQQQLKMLPDVQNLAFAVAIARRAVSFLAFTLSTIVTHPLK